MSTIMSNSGSLCGEATLGGKIGTYYVAMQFPAKSVTFVYLRLKHLPSPTPELVYSYFASGLQVFWGDSRDSPPPQNTISGQRRLLS